jgi:uncharacterized repeat protein (TIGR03847 family)
MLELSEPEHVTADFVGEPGERTFYIQAVEAAETLTVLVEKQQVAALVTALVQLLAELGSEPPEVWDVDGMRLREPVDPRWRAGQIAVGIDPDVGRLMLELIELVPEEEIREPEEIRVWLTEEQSGALAAHAAWAVAQGRPTCELCGNPLDPEGHLCPRMNGDLSRR